MSVRFMWVSVYIYYIYFLTQDMYIRKHELETIGLGVS